MLSVAYLADLFTEQTLQSVSQAPTTASCISPTLDIGKNANRRSRKNERPLPTKALPASTVLDSEGSLAPSTKDSESVCTADKTTNQQQQQESSNIVGSVPEVSIPSRKDAEQINVENKSVSSTASHSQVPTVSAPLTSVAKGEAVSTTLSTEGAPSGTVGPENPVNLPGFLPVGNTKVCMFYVVRVQVLSIGVNLQSWETVRYH